MKKITPSNVSLLLLILSSAYVRSAHTGKERNGATACSKSTQAAGTEPSATLESSGTGQKREVKHQRINETQGVKRGSVNLAPSALWELRRKLSAARSENKEFGESDSDNKETVQESASTIPTFQEASVRTKPLTITTYHEGQDYRKATVSTDDNNNAEKFIFHLDNEPHMSLGDDVGDRNDDMPYLMKHQNTHSKYVVNIDDDEKVANFLKKTKEEEEAREKSKPPPTTTTTPAPTKNPFNGHHEDEDDNELFAKHSAKTTVKDNEQEPEVVQRPRQKPKLKQENEVVEKPRKKLPIQQVKDNSKATEPKIKKPFMGEDPKLSGVPDAVYTGFKPSLRKPFSDREEDLNGEREDKPKKKTPEKAVNYPSPHFAWQKEVVATLDDPEFVQPADENDIKEEKTQVQIRDENKKNVSYTPVIVAEKATNYSNDTMDMLQKQDMANFTTLNGSNPVPSDEYFVASESLESDMNGENANIEPPMKDVSSPIVKEVAQPLMKPIETSPIKDAVPSMKDTPEIKEDMASFMKENAQPLVDDKKNAKIVNQYQQENDNDNLKISEQMDKLLIKEKVATQGKKRPIGKIALTEISKTGNLTNPGEFIHSAGKQLVLPGRFAANFTTGGIDSFMPTTINFKNPGSKFINNGSMNDASNGYEDEYTFENSDGNAAKEFRGVAEEGGGLAGSQPNLSPKLKSLQAIEAAQRVESYANSGSELGNSKYANSFTTPHDSDSSTAQNLALLANKQGYSPTENLIISKKLREIDSRAKAPVTSLNNMTFSHGPQTKEQFLQREKAPVVSDLASIPAQVVLSPANIGRLSGYKKPEELNKMSDGTIAPDPFHKKMAAYDSYLKHVGSNVIDTDACLRSDDPLKCENKEILKSSAVISKLDKELSKISSSAINELNQELSRTPTPGASIVKIDKTSAPKGFNNEIGEKFFDSPPDDAINESSKSSADTNKDLLRSQSTEEFSKDETDKSPLADDFGPMESFAEPSKEEMDKDFTLNPSFDPMKKHPLSSAALHACLRSDDPIKCENKQLNKELQEKNENERLKSSESLLSFSSDDSRGGSKRPSDDSVNSLNGENLSKSSDAPLKLSHASLKDMENKSESTSESEQQIRKYADEGNQFPELESHHNGNSYDSKLALTTSMFKHLNGEKPLAQVHPLNVFGKSSAVAERLARIKAARYILAQKHRYAMELKRRKTLADQARMFAAACRQGKNVMEMKKRGLISENMPSSCAKKYTADKLTPQALRYQQSHNNHLNIIDKIIQNHNNKNNLLIANRHKDAFKTALNRSLPESNFNGPAVHVNAALKDDQSSEKYKSFHGGSAPLASLSDNDDHKYGTLLHKLNNLKSMYSKTRPTSIFNSKITNMLSKNPSEGQDHYNSRAFGRKFSTFTSAAGDNTLAPYKPPHPKGPSIVFDQFTSAGSHGGALMFPSQQNREGSPQTLVTRTHISNHRGKHLSRHSKHKQGTKRKHTGNLQTRDKEKTKTGPNYGYGSGNGHGYGTNSWGWGGGGGWAGKPPPGGIPSPGEYGPPGSSSEPAQDQPAQDQPAQPAAPAKPAAPSAPSAPSAPAAPTAPQAAPSSPAAASTNPAPAAAASPSPPPQALHEINKTTNKTMTEKVLNTKLVTSKEKQVKYVKNEPTILTPVKESIKTKKAKSFANIDNNSTTPLSNTDSTRSSKRRGVRKSKTHKTKSHKKNVKKKI